MPTARESLDHQLPHGTGPELPDAAARRDESLPLSLAQESVWFQELLQPDVAVYNIPLVFRLRGPLVAGSLQGALADVVTRHEALRSFFPFVDGHPVQVVADNVEVPWSVEDLWGGDQAAVLHRAEHDAHTPFDLARGPLLRALLLRVGEHEHVLVLTVHHIVFDGWSQGVLLRELAHFHRMRSSDDHPRDELPELALQYGDFAVWQREYLRSDAMTDQLRYWRDRLADAPPVLELPTDRPRPAVQSFRCGCERVTLPTELVTDLRELCRREGVTMFMALLTAFNILLTRHTGQEDIVVGTPIANRTQVELEPVIGFLVNTLVLRNDLSGDPSVRDLLAQVRDTFLDAYANQDVPFDRIVEELQPERDLSRSPLIQAMFSLHSTEEPPHFTGLSVEQVDIVPGAAKFDVSMFFREVGDDLVGGIEYCSALFDAPTVRRMLDHYVALLRSMVRAPAEPVSTLRMLSDAEYHELVYEWNATDEEWGGDVGLHELFEAQAARTPDDVAVRFGADSITYRELDERANRLAQWLCARQVGPGHIIGVCVDRSVDMLTGPLAVLKTGAAYVPMDPSHPWARLAVILGDADVHLVITEDRLAQRFDDFTVFCVDRDWPTVSDLPARRPDRAVAPADLAYVIYTSGSTGRPKGVMIEHGSIVNYVRGLNAAIGLGPADRVLAVTTVAFDLTIYDFFGPLMCGATVVVADRATATDGPALSELLDGSAATVIQATPATWRMLLACDWRGSPALRAICCGEALSAELAEQLVQRTGCLWNMYGTTETTVLSTMFKVDHTTLAGSGSVSIGRPLPNTRMYVVDQAMNVVPVGVPGELLIGGAGVGRGYRNRPDLNADRFVEDPFAGRPGARVYRTGDLAHYRPDGNLELLGRLDHQIKLRGFRIELGEIDSVLTRVPGVTGCATILREDTPGEPRLVAYFTSGDDHLPASRIREALQAELPDYMVPTAFVELDELPLNFNKKIDRKRLPQPDETHIDTHGYLAPRDDIEQALAEIFAEVLQLPADRVSVHDDFFKLGGHSLLATRVMARVRTVLSAQLTPRDIFQHPTVAQLATVVAPSRPTAKGGRPAAAVRPRPAGAIPPLSRFQEQLWFMEQFAPATAAYSVAPAQRWRGKLDEEALRTALNALVVRHEALRMTFPSTENGKPTLVISDADTLELRCVDLTAEQGDASSAEDRAAELVAAEAVLPFDIESDPLVRAMLIRLADDDHVLTLAMHHIICDGWSIDILHAELRALYAEAATGSPAGLPELPVQFGDYTVWHRARLASGAVDADRDYWRSELADVSPLTLPTDRPRPDQITYTASSLSFRWDRGLVDDLTRVAAEQGATLYMVLMAVYQATLARYSRQTDFAIGSPSAGRVRPELDGVVGPFVNMLPIRARLDGDPTFREIIVRVKESCLLAFEHQEVPFVEMVVDQNLKRDLSRSAIFQTTFALQSYDARPMNGQSTPPSGPSTENFTYPYTRTRFDLSLFTAENEDGLSCVLLYRDDLWDRESVARFGRNLELLATKVSVAPETALSLLPPVSGTDM